MHGSPNVGAPEVLTVDSGIVPPVRAFDITLGEFFETEMSVGAF